jgi:hypothetical protein
MEIISKKITLKQLQKLVKEVELRVVSGVLSDINFGYDIDMIKHKLKQKNYTGNSVETFKIYDKHLRCKSNKQISFIQASKLLEKHIK